MALGVSSLLMMKLLAIFMSEDCWVLRGDNSETSESLGTIEEGDSMAVSASLCEFMLACGVKAWSRAMFTCCSFSLDVSESGNACANLSCSLLWPDISTYLFLAFDLGDLAFLLLFSLCLLAFFI